MRFTYSTHHLRRSILASLLGVGAVGVMMVGVVMMSSSATAAPVRIEGTTGLQRTGVNAAGNKINRPNVADPHWDLQVAGGQYRQAPFQSGRGPGDRATCQDRPAYIRGYVPAYSIEEGSENRPDRYAGAGWYGTRRVWQRVDSSTRWIGQNQTGEHVHSILCPDPTFTPASPGNPYLNTQMNTYTFRLKEGFTIPAGYDLSTVQINIRGGADNLVEYIVNGQSPLGGTEVGSGRPIQNPFIAGGISNTNASHFVSGTRAGLFRQGSNTLEVKVYSTFSNAGLRIEDIWLTAERAVPTYALTPSVQDLPAVVEPDSSVDVRSTINNSGANPSRPAQWQLTQVVVQPGGSITGGRGGGASASDPSGFYQGSGITHSSSLSGNNRVFNRGVANMPVHALQVGDMPVGTEICFGLSVKDRAHNDTRWAHSALRCTTIGKSPKTQIHGSSLMVGRSFGGTVQDSGVFAVTTNRRGASGAERTFGSWSEYAIMAPGRVEFMASGAGLSGEGAPSRDQTRWSGLTFTRGSGTGFGYYTYAQPNLPDVRAMFPVSDATPSVGGTTNPAQLSGSGARGRVVTATGNLTIEGGSLAEGRWAVLHAPNANVTISGAIEYANGPFSRPSQIPQLIIIARNITVNHDVGRVDGWLIASNAISTCQQQAAGAGTAQWLSTGSNYTSNNARLTHEHCNQPLTVNGPIMTNKLYLRRTAGSQPATPGNPGAPGEPAEVFNLRPDAYLWAQAHMNTSNVYQTTNLRELPPRY